MQFKSGKHKIIITNTIVMRNILYIATVVMLFAACNNEEADPLNFRYRLKYFWVTR